MASSTASNSIEPAVVLPAKKRRKLETNWELCIFCQGTAEELSSSSPQGIKRVKLAYEARITHGDDDMLTRLKSDMSTEDHLSSKQPKWHKICYASFTSQRNIEAQCTERTVDDPIASTSSAKPLTRQVIGKVSWTKCIFCQKRKHEKVHKVQSVDVQESINKAAQFDYDLKCRIGHNKMIAYEAHYNSSCKHKAEKDSRKQCSDETGVEIKHDAPFAELITILDKGFDNGHIYSIDLVLEKYLSLMASSGIKDPSCWTHVLKQKLQRHYGGKILFRKQRQANQPLILIPASTTTEEVIELLASKSVASENLEFKDLTHESNFMHSLHTVVTKLKADLKSTPGHQGYDNLNQTSAEKCIPDSLYLFIKWMFASDEIDLEEKSEHDKFDPLLSEDRFHKHILDIGHNIVYNISMGRKLTPKHIGTGLLVHHMTRSKLLVEYLHAGGDSVSYATINRIDTSIAQSQLSRFVENDNTFIPENYIPGRFMHFAADNFDMQEENLDGRGTLHVTQMAVFQRGPPPPPPHHQGRKSNIGRGTTLGNIPPEFNQITTADAPPQNILPHFSQPVTETSLNCPSSSSGNCKKIDLAWLMSRNQNHDIQNVPAWTGFNRKLASLSTDISTIGYLPIIPAPAHHLDTLMTVLLRCKKIAEQQDQSTTVITLDKALYHKAKELVWLYPKKLRNVIIRLGGFHIAMNYLGVIGCHFAQSGLTDIWIESDVYSECVAEQIMQGKCWNRAVRAHKLTMEAIWRTLFEGFKQSQERRDKHSIDLVSQHVTSITTYFHDVNTLQRSVEAFTQHADDLVRDMDEYFAENANNPTFLFWKQYIDMVETLLLFIRADKDGDWELHITSFKEMLPLMLTYDHTNYSRWGVVYLIDMLQLEHTAPSVYQEFLAGNFAVKEANGSFNQIATDQALEHINKQCKVAGGLVGITQIQSALNQWMITFSDRARLTNDIRQLVGLASRKSPFHSDQSLQRMSRDDTDVKKLQEQIERFNPFDRECEDLMCISTNDVVPQDIKQDLLTASERGLELLNQFVENRLFENSITSLHDTIPKNKSKTFANIHNVEVVSKTGKSETVKADRDLFRRLLSAASSGRQIDLSALLKHELAPVPLSIATVNQKLRPTEKAALLHLICDSFVVDQLPVMEQPTCVIVDGMATVQAMGKPAGANTFGDFADCFCERVFSHLKGSQTRLDIVLDEYRAKSIKSGTRGQRTDRMRKIRRVIDGRNICVAELYING